MIAPDGEPNSFRWYFSLLHNGIVIVTPSEGPIPQKSKSRSSVADVNV